MRLRFDPWMGRHGSPLQSSCLENPMDRGAWWATVHRVSRVGRDCVICISEIIDIFPSDLDSSLCFFQPSISHDVLCITLPTKVRLVKAMVFPVVRYGCENWTVKRQRIDAFKLWCWRRLLRVPWTVRRSNQSILTEVSPGISLEGMMLKLKLQYFGHLM